MHVIFLHGKESGPHGSKFQSIRGAGWDVEAPDCEGIDDIDRRVAIARETLAAAADPCVIVGSSYGGLAASLLIERMQDPMLAARLHGVLLLAPALHLVDAEDLQVCHANTQILHGTQDDVVPVEASRAFAERTGGTLVEVEDGHRLADSHAEMLEMLEQVAGRSPTP